MSVPQFQKRNDVFIWAGFYFVVFLALVYVIYDLWSHL